jgi:protein CpxP
MSFNSKLSSLFAMVFAFAAFSVAVSAQDAAKVGDKTDKMEHRGGGRHGGFGKGMRGGHGGMMGELRGINLTDAQKEQLRTIHEANKPDLAVMEQMKSLMEARRAGTLTDDQKQQMKTLREQQRAKHEQVRAQVLAILTPEQLQQVEAKRQEMQQRREERRQQRREGRTDAAKPTDN